MKIAFYVLGVSLLAGAASVSVTPASAGCDGFQGCSLDCPCTQADAALRVGSPPPEQIIAPPYDREVTTGSISPCSANLTQNRYGLVRGTSTHKAGVC